MFVNQATGYLTIDIINEFVPYFKQVALITGSVRVQDIELCSKVEISKTIRYNRGSPVKKFGSWFFGTIQIFILLLFKYRKYDVFYFTIPPFAYLLSLILPNKFSVLVFDVYPDVLKVYGIKKSNLLYKLWKKCNVVLFQRAENIFTIGEGMMRLLENYTPGDRIKIISLWTGLTRAVPIPKLQNKWLTPLNLNEKFIVQYSGNIGYTHNVEMLIEVANKMKDEDWCHFLIIGRGDKVEMIKHLIDNYALTNCTLLPFQPDEQLVYSLAAADLGVVILDEKVADVSLPSKIYNLQAVGVPVLGISPSDSELNKHLQKYENGACFCQDDQSQIIKYIKQLYADRLLLNRISNNSLTAAEDFSIANAKLFYQHYVS